MSDPAFEYYLWKETRQIKKLLQKMDKETELQAEIERLKETTTLLQRECAKRGIRIADLERLLTRAADTLEAESCTEYHDLIAELRKAAE